MKSKRFILTFILTFIFCFGSGQILQAKRSPVAPIFSAETSIIAANPNLEQEAQRLYETRQFDRAIQLLREAAQDYEAQGDVLGQAGALRNLALTYIKTGNLEQANAAIAQSLALVQTLSDRPEATQLQAEILEVRGQQELTAGDSRSALETWQNASELYEQANDIAGITRSQINRTQALQSLGLYNQAIKSLGELQGRLNEQPDTLLKAKALQSLGDVLRAVGNLEASRTALAQSLAIAEKFQDRDTIASILIGAGNTARAATPNRAGTQQPARAEIEPLRTVLTFYRRAATTALSPELSVQAQLNELSLLVEQEDLIETLARLHPPNEEQLEKAQIIKELADFVQRLQTQIGKLPQSRSAIYARINFVHTLSKLERVLPQVAIAQNQLAETLATAVRDARSLGDKQAEAYALGILGQLYQQDNNLEEARKALERGLAIAQANNARDIAYQWQWQLGQILGAQGDRESAIAAYSQSVNTLKSIRSDLAAVTSEVQFSFRESVEPVYRQFVDLLLQKEPTEKDLQQARLAIEALQLAELDNFFREACTDATPVQIDQVDVDSAVFYAVILEDRLEVILALPGQPLRHYSTPVERTKVEGTISLLERAIALRYFSTRSRGDIPNSPLERAYEEALQSDENPSRSIVAVRALDPDLVGDEWRRTRENLYHWLIQPAEQDIANSGTKTLVFVLDGALRRIPMAVLHDGQQYLIEKYAVALTPGLQLLDPKPLPRSQLRAIAAGLSERSEKHPNFPPIPNVEKELKDIKAEVESEQLLNQDFTERNFNQLTESSPAPVVHLATHGQFSSSAEETFILTWDDTLDANELKYLLQADPRQKSPVELLILSACETATGDERAALGLAGVAVRAGARSTMASLWKVSDEATAELMRRFYQEFKDESATKAEALQRAQLELLRSDRYYDPYFWAAFVLVGNWL